MKFKNRLISIIIMIATSPCISIAGLVLSSGQSFEYEFHSIYSTTPFSDDPFAYARFNLGSDSLSEGDSMVFSVFEDNTNQPAIRSETITYLPDLLPWPIGSGEFETSVAEAPWQDHQGIFRIEVISGTIELDSFESSTVNGGNYYHQIYVIPEPHSVALLFIGSGLIYLKRKRFPSAWALRGKTHNFHA
ncbi:MAG: PEP-CTERM sorting domain-containing protein [Kiritimatiellales bacterium]|nr:PEP-CTERM sorting domain-containing protein [Kiritimatiellales bacterium]